MALTHCPHCDESLPKRTPDRCPSCDARLTRASAAPDTRKPVRPSGKKKRKPAMPSKLPWVLGGAAAGGLLVIGLGVWLVLTLTGGGKGGGGLPGFDDLTHSSKMVVVDEVPEATINPEPEQPPPPEEKPKTRVEWKVRPDPVSKPEDLSQIAGTASPYQKFLFASRGGPFFIGVHIEPSKPILNKKTNDPSKPFERVDLTGKPAEVVDYRTGKAVGGYRVPVAGYYERLGPDGKLLLRMGAKIEKGMVLEYTGDLELWRPDADKPAFVWRMPATPHWYDFVDARRVAVWIDKPASTLVLLDVDKPEPVWSVPVPTDKDRQPHLDHLQKPRYFNPSRGGAVSPNGQYITLGDLQGIGLYSVADGTRAGLISIRQPQRYDHVAVLTFDASGQNLLALLARPGASKLARAFCWSTATGRLVQAADVEVLRFDRSPLVAGPDADSFSYGYLMYDWQSGAQLGLLPYQPLAWVGPDRVIARGYDPKKMIGGEELAKKSDMQAMSVIGPAKFDKTSLVTNDPNIPITPAGTLPPRLTRFDDTIAATPTDPPATWAFTPVAVPDLPPQSKLSEWPTVWTADSGIVISAEAGVSYRRIDLKTGQTTPAVKLETADLRPPGPPETTLQYAVSADGKQIARVSGADQNRIDIWDAAGKHVVAFRPFGEDAVTWVGWSSRNHLLTGSKLGLCGWDIAARKAVFRVDGEFTSWLPLTGQNVLVGAGSRQVDLFDTETGRCLGRIAAPADADYTASPDGKLLVQRAAKSPSRLWDLATGKPVRLTDDVSPIGQWANGRRLVTATATEWQLFDLDARTATYRFAIPAGGQVRSDTLGRSWYHTAAAAEWRPIDWPGVNGLKVESAFAPGATVRVEADIGHTPASERYARTTAERLRDRGFKIGKGGWVLKVENTVGTSGKAYDDPITGKASVRFTALTITRRLLAPDGAEAWKAVSTVDFTPFSSKYVRPGSRSREGGFGPNGGGSETVQLDYDGKDPRAAQIEEIAEGLANFRSGVEGVPVIIAKTDKGLEPLPLPGTLPVK